MSNEPIGKFHNDNGSADRRSFKCAICGTVLEVLSTELRKIYRDEAALVQVDHHTTMLCPKKRGIFGFLFQRHDRRVFRDDGSEVMDPHKELEVIL